MEERAPAVVPKAVEIRDLQRHPPADGPLCNVDEKAGIGVRAPTAPGRPAARGRPARREFEYARHGTASLLAAFQAQTGQVHGLVRQRRRAAEFIELLRLLDARVPKGQASHLILDPGRLQCSAEVAVYVAYRPWRFRSRWLPLHAAWLSFIEAWFAIPSKKCLARSDLADFAAAERHRTAFIATYHAHHARPFARRKGVRFCQRLRDKLAAGQAPAPALTPAA